MPSRTVELTEGQAELVERLVRSGRYRSASDVVSDGLDLLLAEDAENVERLRTEIDLGVADLEAGRSTTFESRRELRVHLDRLTKLALDE